MNLKKTLSVLLVATAVTAGLAGCGGKGTDKVAPEVGKQTSAEATKEKVTPENVDKTVKQEISDIKYDLTSIINSSRDAASLQQYKVEAFAPVAVAPKPATDDKAKEAEKKADTAATVKDPVKPAEDPASIKSFLDLTKTAKADYTDVAIAFYPEKGYIIGIVKPAKDKEVAVEQAIRSFLVSKAETGENNDIKDNFKNYKMVAHNGYYAIVVSIDSENIKNKMAANMENVDKLIQDAVREQLNKDTTPAVDNNKSTETAKPADATKATTDEKKVVAPKDGAAITVTPAVAPDTTPATK